MKRAALLVCLLVVTMAAQAQFEKGKWVVDTSISGLNFSHNTGTGHTNFGFEVQGGAFLVDNLALLVDIGAKWPGGDANNYEIGVGARYYFEKVGIYVGADLHANHWTAHEEEDKLTRIGFGMDVGYAFFLSKSVALEPALFWNIDKDRSEFGVKVGFGFYF